MKPNIFALFDAVKTVSQSYQKSSVISPGGPTINRGLATNLITSSRSSLWIKTLLPKEASVGCRTASRFKIVGKEERENEYFLNVMEVAEAGKTVQSTSFSLVESSENLDPFIGAYIPPRGLILFSKIDVPIK